MEVRRQLAAGDRLAEDVVVVDHRHHARGRLLRLVEQQAAELIQVDREVVAVADAAQERRVDAIGLQHVVELDRTSVG